MKYRRRLRQMREAASEGMEGKKKYVERGGNETRYGGREEKLQE